MAAILTRRPRATSQPQQAVGIDWSNPLVAGMSLAVNFGAGQAAFDLVSGLPNVITGTKASRGLWGGTSFGATVGASTADNVKTPIVSDVAQRSYLVFAKIRAVGGGNLGRLLSSGQLGVYYDSGYSAIQFQTAFASGSNNASIIANYVLGTPFCAAMSFDASLGSNTPAVAVDGALRTPTMRGTGTGARTAQGVLYVGNAAAGTRVLDGDVYMVAAWDRLLTPDELVEVSRNPWQLFAAQAPRRIFLPANATAPSTGTVAAAGAKGQIAAAGGPRVAASAALSLSKGVMAASGAPATRGTAALVDAPDRISAQAVDPDRSYALLVNRASMAAMGAVVVAGTAALAQSPGSAAVTGQVEIAAHATLTQGVGLLAATGNSGVDATGALTAARAAMTASAIVANPGEVTGFASLSSRGDVVAAGDVRVSAAGDMRSVDAMAASGVVADHPIGSAALVAEPATMGALGAVGIVGAAEMAAVPGSVAIVGETEDQVGPPSGAVGVVAVTAASGTMTARGTALNPRPATRAPVVNPLFKSMGATMLTLLGEPAIFNGATQTRVNVQYGVQLQGLQGDGDAFINDFGAERDVATISQLLDPRVGDTFQFIDAANGGTVDMPAGPVFRLEKRVRKTGVNMQFVVLEI